MANKRMFNMKIVDSDAFLDMPMSAQCLYFHLNMRADDDGFVGNPKRIMREVGGNEDDLKLLILKSFLLTFENGVIVIKHWRMHNCIQSDRYTETTYTDEKALLGIKKNKSYSFDKANCIKDLGMETKCIQNVSTDIDIDLDKDKELDIDKESKKINYQLIVDMYNDTCVSFPRLKSLSDSRKKAIRARLKVYSLDDFQRLFTMAEQSKFLKGANDRNWSATFDWLIKDSNMAKVLDGNYTDREEVKPKEPKGKFDNFELPPGFLAGGCD